MSPPTLTCEHCESEIDVAKDPKCIQDGGLDVICADCRERAFQQWRERTIQDWPYSDSERLRAAYRVTRGWQA